MLVNTPAIPPTNDGIRQFLQELSQAIAPVDVMCPGYSVASDPSGRILVSATCVAKDQNQYSIRVELVPVEEGGAL